jgi:Ca2+-binding EF-hand superfamily protein
MHRNIPLSALALAAILGATLTTAALAERGGAHGMGMMGPMVDFTELDSNADGKVTKDEVAAFRAARVAALDANKDGKIIADELQAQIEARMAERAAAMAARMIEMRDTDGDGLLSAAELAEAPMPPMGDMLFDLADADDDGAVTREEFDTLRERAAARMEGHGPGHGHGPHGGWGWFFGPRAE